jgi:hypothetical protein
MVSECTGKTRQMHSKTGLENDLIKTREHNDLFKTNFKGMLFGEAKI